MGSTRKTCLLSLVVNDAAKARKVATVNALAGDARMLAFVLMGASAKTRGTAERVATVVTWEFLSRKTQSLL